MKIISLNIFVVLSIVLLMPDISNAAGYEVKHITAQDRKQARLQAAQELEAKYEQKLREKIPESDFEEPDNAWVNIDIDLTNPELQFRDESLATRCLKPYNTAYNAVQGTEHDCIKYDWDGDDYSSDDISGKDRNFYNTQ